jgi:hypothetical protein
LLFACWDLWLWHVVRHRGFLVMIVDFVLKTKPNGSMQCAPNLLILTASVSCSGRNVEHSFKGHCNINSVCCDNCWGMRVCFNYFLSHTSCSYWPNPLADYSKGILNLGFQLTLLSQPTYFGIQRYKPYLQSP